MEDFIIALAGNPNVGKSTVFNALTGMKQHTGNWAGKTVSCAEGSFEYKDRKYVLADIPGIYSLVANSAEEKVAHDFICSGRADGAIVVCDASCLERNLTLVLQVMDKIPKTVVCVNLIDEAEKKGIHVNADRLSEILGVPVVLTSARNNKGLDELCEAVNNIAENEPAPLKLNLPENEDDIISTISRKSSEIAAQCVECRSSEPYKRDRKLEDRKSVV